jgi:hypothetical protein
MFVIAVALFRETFDLVGVESPLVQLPQFAEEQTASFDFRLGIQQTFDLVDSPDLSI